MTLRLDQGGGHVFIFFLEVVPPQEVSAFGYLETGVKAFCLDSEEIHRSIDYEMVYLSHARAMIQTETMDDRVISRTFEFKVDMIRRLTFNSLASFVLFDLPFDFLCLVRILSQKFLQSGDRVRRLVWFYDHRFPHLFYPSSDGNRTQSRMPSGISSKSYDLMFFPRPRPLEVAGGSLIVFPVLSTRRLFFSAKS